MQAGSFVAGDVLSLSSRILVGGVERKFKEWKIDRDLDGDLPEQVVAGSGIKQATGSIVWDQDQDLTGTSANPWNPGAGWLPAQGVQVIIYVSDGVTEWAQFVGVIDENSGDVGSLPTSTIVDYIDYLNRPVSHSTVLRLHPPKSEGADYLGVGMSSAYPVDRALRRCGLYATPAMEPGVAFSVPAQASMWPEYGTLTAAGSFTGGTKPHADNYRASWGWCLADFSCSYTPGITITRTDPIQLTARIGLDHAGNFTLNAFYGATRIQLAVAGSRTAIARLDGTDVVSLVMEPGFTIITLQVKAGAWTLKTNGGATATGSAAIPAGVDLSTITTTGDADTRAAGMQISKPPAGQEFKALSHNNTYYQETGLFAGLMDVLPSYVDRPAIDLLTEISKANLAAMWFNEIGQFRFIGSDILRSQAPAQTITTLDDIRSLSWSDARLGMRSKVRVKYRLPILNRSRYSNVLLWQGSGETMGSGQEKSLIAEAPAGEDWAEIDHGAVGTAGGLTAFNAGQGTWVGGYLEDGAGAWSSSAGYNTWDPIVTLDERTRLFKVTTITLPAGKTYVLATPDDATNYFPRFRGFSFPVLRGRAKVTWTDASVESVIAGPSGFPELEHDAGPWAVQADNTVIQDRIADFVAEQVTVPAPTIPGLRVGYDPRRQLGDVVTISSPDLMGVTINALIVGIRNASGKSFTQSLKVRIVSASSVFTTYAQFETAHPDTLTYEQWRVLFPSTATYDYFDNDPLRGASIP